MQTWQLVLKLRRRVCEHRLWSLYDRHGDLVARRATCPEMGPAWKSYDDKMALVVMYMRREMEEIRHLRTMQRTKPMGGLTTVAHKDGKLTKGPSIRELIERLAEKEQRNADLSKEFTQTKRDHSQKAEGLLLALEVMNNPYRYLDEDERAAFDAAEDAADDVVAGQACEAPDARRVLPGGKQGPSLAQVKASKADTTVVVRRKATHEQD